MLNGGTRERSDGKDIDGEKGFKAGNTWWGSLTDGKNREVMGLGEDVVEGRLNEGNGIAEWLGWSTIVDV